MALIILKTIQIGFTFINNNNIKITFDFGYRINRHYQKLTLFNIYNFIFNNIIIFIKSNISINE